MAAPDWAPTAARIAALLRARTRGAASRDASVSGEQDSFTPTTRPTLAQVEELIEIACGELGASFAGRTPCTTELADSAGTAAAYRACQLVEVSYFPEQTTGDGTAYSAFKDLADSAFKSVTTAITDRCPLIPDPGAPADDDGGPMAAIGVIPEGPLVGRRTVW